MSEAWAQFLNSCVERVAQFQLCLLLDADYMMHFFFFKHLTRASSKAWPPLTLLKLYYVPSFLNEL